MAIELNGTTGITTPDVNSDGLTVDTTTLVVDEANNRVGIGTSSPATSLHIKQTTDALPALQLQHGDGDFILCEENGGTDLFKFSRAAGTNDLAINVVNSASVKFYTNNTERARIDSSGNFYLSGNQTLGPLTDNQGTIGDGSHRWRVIYAVNGTIQTSDVTQKTDVQASSLGLDFINSLNPVSFRWIDSTYGRTHYGFIAQEIEQTLNDSNAGDFGGLVIDEMEDGSRLYGLRHHELIAPMVKAMQEQQALITAQQTALQEALTKIETLEARVAALEAA